MTDSKNSGRINVYMPVLFAFVLIIGMQLGFKMYETLKGKKSLPVNTSSTLSELEEIFNYIDNRYVDSIKSNALLEKVIGKTLENLDPHSNYIPAKDLQEVKESLQGNFEGIGVEFAIVKDTIVVVTPIANGPSEKLGILAGDKIIEIEDSIVAGKGITNQKVIEKLRGTKGTTVKVSIYRNGVEELIDYPIKRDKIPLHSVDIGYMIDKEVGYIKINRFSATTYNEFMENLINLKESGMEKLVLDLRQNPGGYLTAAVNIVDEFLDGDKLIVYTQGRNYKKKEYKARRRGMFEEGELVVLLDSGSASASEIISGAIQDWDRGTILGRRSFGKGLVQEQYDLKNGSALRLTVARYYTPSGRCIQKPYSDGVEAYQKELIKRSKGKTDTSTIADSLQYKTLIKERIVFGGGGISPDIFVPIDTSSNEPFSIKARSLVAEFSYDYFSNNQSFFHEFSDFASFQNKFQVNDEIFAKFIAYVKKSTGKVDEKLLNRDKKDLQVSIKSRLARQLWNDEGFYPIIHEIDETLQKAYKEIQKS